MSYLEYDDLFEKAQITGKYMLFCFDVKDSQKILPNSNREIYNKLNSLLYNVYQKIKKIEEIKQIKILHKNNALVSLWNLGKSDGRVDLYEPAIFGDSAYLTVIRDTITPNLVYNIWEEEKEKLKIDYEFHKTYGYYDTDDYNKRGELYFRGYCMIKLEVITKKKTKKKKKILTLN